MARPGLDAVVFCHSRQQFLSLSLLPFSLSLFFILIWHNASICIFHSHIILIHITYSTVAWAGRTWSTFVLANFVPPIVSRSISGSSTWGFWSIRYGIWPPPCLFVTTIYMRYAIEYSDSIQWKGTRRCWWIEKRSRDEPVTVGLTTNRYPQDGRGVTKWSSSSNRIAGWNNSAESE
jgi:hypothetical protein